MNKWLARFAEKNAHTGPDKTDKSSGKSLLSGLSGVNSWLFPGNESQILLDKECLLYDFEERQAIAQFDGKQSPEIARCMAYQETFIRVLNSLPYERTADSDWFKRRIQQALRLLRFQDLCPVGDEVAH